MTRVAILGIATYDEVLLAGAAIGRSGTVRVEHFGSDAVRCGGAPLYAGRALASAGYDVSPVFTVGDDAAGGAIVAACREEGLNASGIARLAGARTPRCLTVFDPDGNDLCLFDAGHGVDLLPNLDQARLLESAALVIISAAPPASIEYVLSRVTDDQRLACIFKDDPACFPDELCDALIRRADFFFHNDREGARIEEWLPSARSDATIFRTLGGDGVLVQTDGESVHIPVIPIAVSAPIGAGDTFAGHALAQLLDGASAIAAAAAAIEQTTRFLNVGARQVRKIQPIPPNTGR